MMPAEPMTFERAQDFLRAKASFPTAKGSRELSLDPAFPAQVRSQAFFSAKVASANVLERLRQEVQSFTDGDVDIATARMRMKRFLASEGYQPDDVADQDDAKDGRRSLENLASTRRLDLILRQNARMAQAMGQRMVSLDPDLVERWPYFQYHSRGDARDGHKSLDGLVLRKDDPFWLTHTPPWEFGCRCWIEDADEDDAKAAGGVGQATVQELPDGSQDATVRNGAVTRRIPPNKSGFVFRVPSVAANTQTGMSVPPNFSAVKNPELRELVKRDVEAKIATLAADPVLARLVEIEDSLVGNDYETIVSLDADGQERYRREGGKTGESRYKVAVDMAKIKGTRVTHNHPRGLSAPLGSPLRRGNSFSPQDLLVAVEAELLEMRAVSPAWRHSMRPPEGGWPSLAAVKKMLKRIHNEVRRESDKLPFGSPEHLEAQAEHYHNVSLKFAEETGAIYRRDPR